MGSKHSAGYAHNVLAVYEIGKVRLDLAEDAPVYSFYIRPGKDIIALAASESLHVVNNEISKWLNTMSY